MVSEERVEEAAFNTMRAYSQELLSIAQQEFTWVTKNAERLPVRIDTPAGSEFEKRQERVTHIINKLTHHLEFFFAKLSRRFKLGEERFTRIAAALECMITLSKIIKKTMVKGKIGWWDRRRLMTQLKVIQDMTRNNREVFTLDPFLFVLFAGLTILLITTMAFGYFSIAVAMITFLLASRTGRGIAVGNMRSIAKSQGWKRLNYMLVNLEVILRKYEAA